MEELIKNVERAIPFSLREYLPYEENKVVSLTLAQQPHTTMTLFSFDAGSSIGTHAAPGDAFVYVLDGEAEITVAKTTHNVLAGEAIVMPANIPHSLKAVFPFKMLLVVVKP